MSNKYLLNTRQEGEGLELLTSLAPKSVDLVILDPQYDASRNVTQTSYPTHFQSEYQIMNLLAETQRILKPSSFCLLWINKALLGSDRITNWLTKSPALKLVDCLVWNKQRIGFGTPLRNNAEFAFLLQKIPAKTKVFKNKSFPVIWEEKNPHVSKRKHPHQKPYLLSKAFIEATTEEQALVVEPCAGSFQLLDICQEINRNYLGVDLTHHQMQDFLQKKYERKSTS